MSIGEILLRAGIVSEAQLQTATAEQQRSGTRIDRALVAAGVIADDTLALVLARQLGLPLAELDDTSAIPPSLADRLDDATLRKLRVFPVSHSAERSVAQFAMSNPLDTAAIEEIQQRLGIKVDPYVTADEAITRTLDRIFGGVGAAAPATTTATQAPMAQAPVAQAPTTTPAPMQAPLQPAGPAAPPPLGTFAPGRAPAPVGAPRPFASVNASSPMPRATTGPGPAGYPPSSLPPGPAPSGGPGATQAPYPGGLGGGQTGSFRVPSSYAANYAPGYPPAYGQGAPLGAPPSSPPGAPQAQSYGQGYAPSMPPGPALGFGAMPPSPFQSASAMSTPPSTSPVAARPGFAGGFGAPTPSAAAPGAPWSPPGAYGELSSRNRPAPGPTPGARPPVSGGTGVWTAPLSLRVEEHVRLLRAVGGLLYERGVVRAGDPLPPLGR